MTGAVLPCRALLFDCDGVLVDSDESVHRSWTRWARTCGLDPQAVTAMVHGRRSADTVALLIETVEREAALSDIDRYEVEDAATVTALPGAIALVRSLPPGTWAVVTSGRRSLTTARLAAAGLPAPEALVCAEDVTAGKPDPAGYLAAAARLGVPPGECVAIEDSPTGVASAEAAGCRVLAVPHAVPIEPGPGRTIVESLTLVDLDDLAALLQ
jgi:sugar-phosphatase